MEQKVYEVHRVTNIVGYNDTFYVLATTEKEAVEKAFPHNSGWWVQFCRYYVEAVCLNLQSEGITKR